MPKERIAAGVKKPDEVTWYEKGRESKGKKKLDNPIQQRTDKGKKRETAAAAAAARTHDVHTQDLRLSFCMQ